MARAIKAKRAGKKADKDMQFPGIEDGVAGMAFIEACEVFGEEREVDEGLILRRNIAG